MHHIGKQEGRSKERGSDMIPEPSPDNSFQFNEFVNAFKVSIQISIISNFLKLKLEYRLWEDWAIQKQENQTPKCSSWLLSTCKSSLSN